MFELEDHHWWFQGRLAVVTRLLERYAPGSAEGPARLLDLGCGTGMFLTRQGDGRLGFGLDVSLRALGYTRRRGLKRLVCGDSQALPFKGDCFDIVTAFDTIEHVEADAQMIGEAHRVLRPGGLLLATVPAHPALWSGHDVALHHKRRYRRREFERLFDPRRWIDRRTTYTFAAIAPAAAVIRSLRRRFPRPGGDMADTHPTAPWLNRTLLAWHRAEAAWLARFDLPFGLSILTLREKK